MKNENLDTLVSLLSTDWFLPHWHVLGISIEDGKRPAFQNGCRDIVRQILGSAKQYWLADFSAERVEKTHSLFCALLEECHADKRVVEHVSELLGEGHSEPLENTGWIILSVVEMMAKGTLDESTALDSSLREQVMRVWHTIDRNGSCEADFERLCRNSHSAWDTFIRNTTPDLPTRLADYVVSTARTDKFQAFWAALTASIPLRQRLELGRWLGGVAESMTGQPLELPDGSSK